MFYLYETQQLQGMAESDDTLVFHPAAGRMQPEELEGAVGGSQQEENGCERQPHAHVATLIISDLLCRMQ